MEQEGSVINVNGSNCKEVFSKSKQTVIYVSKPRCFGCKEIEPLLSHLNQSLLRKFNNAEVQLVKMDINNEVHFLTKVEKTPSFLVYNKKFDAFFDLNIDFSKDSGEVKLEG